MPTDTKTRAFAAVGASMRAPATTAAPILFRKTRVRFIPVPCLGSFGGCIGLCRSVARTPNQELTGIANCRASSAELDTVYHQSLRPRGPAVDRSAAIRSHSHDASRHPAVSRVRRHVGGPRRVIAS